MLVAMIDRAHHLYCTLRKKTINYQEGREIDFPLPHTQQMFHINI